MTRFIIVPLIVLLSGCSYVCTETPQKTCLSAKPNSNPDYGVYEGLTRITPQIVIPF